jgi:hypothetical protein
MSRPFGIALTVVSLGAAVFAAAALAGTDPKVKASKKKSGPYAAAFVPVKVSEPRNLYVKVISKAANAEEVLLYEQAGGYPEDYSIKWFKGKKDISHDVQTGVYEFTLRPDKPRLFRLRMKPDVPGKPRGVCITPVVDDGSGEVSGGQFGVNGNSCG